MNTEHSDVVHETCYDYELKPDFALSVEYHDGSRLYREYLDDEYKYAEIDAIMEGNNHEARHVWITGISYATSGFQESFKYHIGPVDANAMDFANDRWRRQNHCCEECGGLPKDHPEWDALVGGCDCECAKCGEIELTCGCEGCGKSIRHFCFTCLITKYD